MKKQPTICLALLILLCTSAQAQLPSYLPADGLVGWWPFNGNANDESGNGNDGMVYGATLAADRFGNAVSAYSFDGVDDFISISNSSTIDIANSDISIGLWIYSNNDLQDSGYKGLSKGGYDVGSGYELLFRNSEFNDEGVISFVTGPTTHNYTDNLNVNSLMDNWFHVLGVYSNGSRSIYVNGQLQNTISSGNALGLVANAGPLLMGKRDSQNALASFIYGILDDITIYNRALTEQEIQNLYTGTSTTSDSGDGAAPLPQGIPYQAAARDGNGQPVADSPVNVRFSLREGAADGATSYIESHNLTTNSIGLFNTVFGNGTPEQSAFDSINWAATTKFLQVEVDLGNGYVDMGTTQLLSVPYAFRSAQAANIKNAALPIYPDNTAALAGGLVAGEMYRTATGDLKIVY